MKREWLIKAREDKGLTQTEVAKLADVTPQFYYYVEHGERRPSPEIAQKIAKVLGCDWTKFYPKKQKEKEE